MVPRGSALLRCTPQCIIQVPMYFRWAADKLWIYQPMIVFVGQFLQSFKEFPQRQASASFNIGQVLDRMTSASPAGR